MARHEKFAPVDWYAVRMRPPRASRRKVRAGCIFETYRARDGSRRQRAVPQTGREEFVHEMLLRRAGFEVFVPADRVWRRPNRFSEKVLVANPLLTGWMFVGSRGGMEWGKLVEIGVVDIMGSAGRPMRVPEREIVDLMNRFGGGRLAPEAHRYMRSYSEFGEGDEARVAVGPLDGLDVRVVSVGGPSVRVLISLLGREQEVEMPAHHLERRA
ncbi:transcription termination/antitermination protein NusG [Palleronia sp. LCG004]|uniref:transcription termination/antitermination protein NusG n=1 Tax=Palleronia sp. LCG004 TaxID=3079304 RepID=UPI002941D93C|nr:transcription termination/antitermination NusG family protein [Palleronia sp. LCG004]WOI54970.1 hypothetical protein RVY76_07785 [Palleronia sp. LCG004]